MSSLALLSLIGTLQTPAPAPVKMTVYLSGRVAGSATVLQKVGADGSKSVQLSMELKNETVTINLRQESSYDKTGRPIRKFQETHNVTQKTRKTVVVTFDAVGANAVVDEGGKRTVKKIPLPDTAVREDLSEFWFLRDQPKPGAVVKANTVNLETLTWELVTTTYKGTQEITIAGRKVKAHRTESERGVAFIDDKGLPLRLELPNGAIERVW